jgi:outer membrane lipoprotein SlyB
VGAVVGASTGEAAGGSRGAAVGAATGAVTGAGVATLTDRNILLDRGAQLVLRLDRGVVIP